MKKSPISSMKIGFIEPVRKESIGAYNKYTKRIIEERRKYFPIWNNPDLGLLTAAAMVPGNWEVKYIHSFIDEIDYNEEFDIIAIGGMTLQSDNTYKIAQKFKKKGAYIVMGGIHATVLPGEVKKYADTVIIGEAEEIFPQFIEDYSNNKQKPTYYSKGNVDMTKSPIPRFDLIKKKYQNYPIQTTRGCPHNCKFCAATRIYGKKYRHKEVDQVIEEIKFLKSVKNNPFVVFVDDNMFINKSFSYNLLEKLIPLEIKWQAISDVAVGKDKDLLQLLYKAGCKELFVGFESVNPDNIKDVNKSQWKSKRVNEYKAIIKNIQDSGIRVFGAFILGFDKDTKEDFKKIKDFVIENKILGQFTILTPLPGTELYEEFEKSGRLLKNKPWKYYTFVDCVIKHPNFSADELEKATADLYKITYSQEHYARVLGNLIKAYKKLTYNVT
jgi:radical SAM superfamily enzyme YgiQ (UPF0313 family)